MKETLNKLGKNPKLQEGLSRLKPERSVWGVVGVVFFFFVPEVLNYFYSNEINDHIAKLIENSPDKTLGSLLTWSSKGLFTGEIGWFNLLLGVLFLAWIFKK